MPRRLIQKEFEERVLETIGPDYKVLGEYINKDTKILVKHFKCGNEFLKRPLNQILYEILKEKSSTTIEKYLITE